MDALPSDADKLVFGGWRGFWWWRPVAWVPDRWPWPMARPCWPPPFPRKPARTLYVQCRDAAISANTLGLPHDTWFPYGFRGRPNSCWHSGARVPTAHVVASLRNGTHCHGHRCHCPPHHCEGKLGRITWPTATWRGRWR